MPETLEGYRLSPQQRRLWRLARGDFRPYRAHCVLTLAGNLDKEGLRRALEGASERHEALRTRFSSLPGMAFPIQVVEPSAALDFRQESLSDGGFDALLRAERRVALDPTAPPSLRARLLPLERDRHALVLSASTLTLDGASFDALVRDVAALYGGGEPENGAVSYAQVSEWLNEQLSEPDEEGAEFWRRLGTIGAPAVRLPFQRPAATGGRFEPDGVRLDLGRGLTRGLRGVAEGAGLSLAGVVLACWQVLLWRLSGLEQLSIAESYPGRDYEALQGAVGLFARALPVAGVIDPRQPFSAFASRLEETRSEVRRWGEFFLWGRDEAAGGAEDAQGFPTVGFELDDLPSACTAGGVAFSVEHRTSCFDRFAVRLSCAASGPGLRCDLDYDASCFDRPDMVRMAEHFRALAAGAASDPEALLGRLPILTPEARSAVLAEGRGPDRELADASCLHQRFAAWARREPGRAAVRFEETELTYGELDARANRLARHLLDLGAGTDRIVAVLLERSVELVAGLLAVLKAGGAYLVLDPSHPRRRLQYMLEDCGVEIVVTAAPLAERLAAIRGRWVTVDVTDPAIARRSSEPPDIETPPESLAYVVFTSGSTGRPKGVGVEHRHILSYLDAVVERLDLPSGAHYATVSTLAADLGNTMIFPALASGGCLHVLSGDRVGDPVAVAEYFRRHSIDCLKIVPSHMEALTSYAGAGELTPSKRLVLGGEVLSPRLAAALSRAGGGPRLFNHYGPSETTVGVAVQEVSEAGDDPRLGSIPIGRPLPRAQIHLLDASLEPVPAWVAGEMHISGGGVARGYVGRPAKTAERFVPSPHAGRPGARAYRSGDLARRLPDSAIEFLGRSDDQVKFHGFRVELGEIRAALNRHPEVRDSVVRMLPADDGRSVLVAYYVAHQELDSATLRKFLEGAVLEETIPNFFCHLRRLPLGLNGKVNPEALPRLEEIKGRGREGLRAPRTPTEEVLAGVWASVLGLAAVGIDDDFFKLGGHSLLATQLVSRVRSLFEVEVPLRTLFEATTVAAFAARVDRAVEAGGGSAPPPIEPVERSGDEPLSFAQERLWFMDRLHPASTAYNVPVALRLEGELDLGALRRSFDEIVRRHEVLRTTFAVAGEEPRQRVGPARPVPVPVIDLSRLDEPRRGSEARRQSRSATRQPFDLARGPLLRIRLLRLGPGEHAALGALHHIVSDAWSIGVLVREVSELYRAFSSGRPSPLPALPIQYADFAHWQRQWMDGEVLESHLDYWRRRLSGAPVLDLPTDRPRTEEGSTAGAGHRLELSDEVTKALRDLSREEGATEFMTLLAAFDALLGGLSGQTDVVVGTDIANRNRLEGEELIGFFVNHLVLRCDLSGGPTFREVLRRVRRGALEAYGHQDLPFELLVKELRPERSLSRVPLFQVLFVFQNAPVRTLELPGLKVRPMDVGAMTSKFELSLFMEERAGRFSGTWVFRSDLFDPATIARFSECLAALLERVAANPDVRLSELRKEIDIREERRTMETSERREAKIDKLRRVRRRSVDPAAVSLVQVRELEEGRRMPLLVEPAVPGVVLMEWAQGHREAVEQRLLEHGAVLFRGFGIDSVAGFEEVAEALCPDLFTDYGDLPKEEEGEKVYRSTPYPPEKTILFHNESSHMHRWPARQMFFCAQAAREGGETPILDGREVYRRLAPEILRPLEEKGLLYVRNFVADLDVSWQQFFRTSDPAAVERFCDRGGIEYQWTQKGLRTRQRSPAVIRHPKTGEPTFFNQIQLFHVSCLEPEEREALLEVFGEEDLPRNVYYGDGSPIPDSVVAHLSELYREMAVAFPWRGGDLLVLDNMLVAHSRNPFVGPRKIVVAMAEIVHKQDVVPA